MTVQTKKSKKRVTPGETKVKPEVKKPDLRLGRELRRLRHAKHLSVRGLAALLDFSASFISQLENGQTSPSISSLERIALALGVGLRDLFAETGSPGNAFIQKEQRPAIVSEWSKGRIEALTVPNAQIPIDAMIVHLQPKGTSGGRLHAAPTHRFAFVWKGTVTLSLADRDYQLKQGDAMTLQSGTLHRWNNRSGRPVDIVIVSFR
jgi:transcriptional regulator with XRE-family HTH domain